MIQLQAQLHWSTRLQRWILQTWVGCGLWQFNSRNLHIDPNLSTWIRSLCRPWQLNKDGGQCLSSINEITYHHLIFSQNMKLYHSKSEIIELNSFLHKYHLHCPLFKMARRYFGRRDHIYFRCNYALSKHCSKVKLTKLSYSVFQRYDIFGDVNDLHFSCQWQIGSSKSKPPFRHSSKIS